MAAVASEGKPSCKLHHAGRVPAGDLSELFARSHIANGIIVMCRVEEIECLDPNLQFHLSRKGEYFEQRHISLV